MPNAVINSERKDITELWYTEVDKNGFGKSFKVVQTLYKGQSEFQSIDILETSGFGRLLLLDGLVMTTEKDEFVYHEMISHIPLLAHPNPKQVLVIGGGDGGTIREVLKHPSVERAVLCEIDGMVIEASKQWLPTIACALDDPKVEIQVADGAAYVAKHKNTFDVILIDSTDPIGPGARLFNKEFYQNVFEALKPDGIMANQSESPIANPQEIRDIQELLSGVFPVIRPYTATIPTYPGSYWLWNFCSKGTEPLANVNEPVAKEIEKQAKYYNRDVHKAVFALPNFIRELVKTKQAV